MAESSRGLADVVAASTAISDIDGKAGRLFYRGYDVHDLAGRVSFEECVHLLLRGSLPTGAQLARLSEELGTARSVSPIAAGLLGPLGVAGQPMAALRTLVSALGNEDPDADATDPEADSRKAIRLVAAVPLLVARLAAARRGAAHDVVVDPDPELGIAGNFLLQVTGERPSPEATAAFDECLVLHADHTMNAATFAARVCAATLSDMHSAIVAALGTLNGPLHGGADEQVMHTLTAIGSVDAVEAAVRAQLASGQKIMGFGHRIYRTEDPRATHLRRLSERLGQLTGDPTYYEMSMMMEKTVVEVQGLYPNVDFFSASVYAALGIPTDLFTCVFAMARMAGWTAHVMEQHADNRLIRPESEYVGQRDQIWRPIEER
jgi:citrate synthase